MEAYTPDTPPFINLSFAKNFLSKNEKSTRMNRKSTFLAFERLFQNENRFGIDLRNFDFNENIANCCKFAFLRPDAEHRQKTLVQICISRL